MFENLVDCAKNRPTNKRWAFFAATAIAWILVLTASVIGGVILYDARLDEQLSLLTLIQPTPPPPAPAVGKPTAQPNRQSVTKPTYTQTITDRVPDTLDIHDVAPVQKVHFVNTSGLGSNDTFGGNIGPDGGTGDNPGVIGSDNINSTTIPPAPEPPKPVVEKVEKVEKPEPPAIIRRSEGVIRGNALNRVTPEYPSLAKQSHILGDVQVEIIINEQGNVVSTRIISGHPLLQQAALQAAQQWKFNPTALSGTPVKVQGIITFRFSL